MMRLALLLLVLILPGSALAQITDLGSIMVTDPPAVDFGNVTEGSIDPAVFQRIYGTWDRIMTAATTTALQNTLVAAQWFIGWCLLVAVMTMGVQMAYGAVSAPEVVMNCIRLGMAATAVGSAFFTDVIHRGITDDIPRELSAAITGISGMSAAAQLDAMRVDIVQRAAILLSLAQVIDFSGKVSVHITTAIAIATLWGMMLVQLAMSTMVRVLTVLAPIAICLMCFKATAGFALNLAGVIGSYLVAGALLALVAQISVTVDHSYLQSFERAANIEIGIQSLWSVFYFCATSLVITIAIPSVANRICGGAIAGWTSKAGMALSAAAGTARLAGRGATAAVRAMRR